MFAVAADFNRSPYNISGLDKKSSGTFDDFVTYNEEKYLRELLGNLFYDALATNFPLIPGLYNPATAYVIGNKVVYVSKNVADVYLCVANGTGQQPDISPATWTIQSNDTSKRWARLVYGDMYTYYLRPQKWYGMKRLMVPLIYGLWEKYSYDLQTSSGVAVAKNENSDTVSPSVRIARAMNEYAELCAGDFPNVIDWSYLIWPELENSLFGYLYLNSATWDDLVVNQPGGEFKAYLAYSFCYPGKTNVFGI